MANNSFADLAYHRVVNKVVASDQGVSNQDVKALLLKKKDYASICFRCSAKRNFKTSNW